MRLGDPGPLHVTIRAVGLFKLPEPGLHDVSLKIGGWIDALYDAERDAFLARLAAEKSRAKPVVTRLKGLGEMSPLQLRETTMDPATRRLLQLTISARDGADQMMDMMLAKKRAGDRREWLDQSSVVHLRIAGTATTAMTANVAASVRVRRVIHDSPLFLDSEAKVA